jgi:hypothetical protein
LMTGVIGGETASWMLEDATPSGVVGRKARQLPRFQPR